VVEWLEIMNIQTVFTILSLKLADVVISEVVESRYEDPIKLKYSRLRLPIALRFVDLERFRIVKPINERTYDVGFIARLEPEKGLPEFLCAIKLLDMEGRRLRIFIGGGGSLLEYTKKFVYKNIDTTIRSYIPHREITRILNEIKIFVLPSKREGVPTILLEALACGVIPIASKVGGIPWLLNTAGVGVLLDSPTCTSIYRALKTLLTLDYVELKKLSNRGREFIERYLSLHSAIKRYQVLKEVING
jgi:glycosyltransferase involved in cell wall biosynthesis